MDMVNNMELQLLNSAHFAWVIIYFFLTFIIFVTVKRTEKKYQKLIIFMLTILNVAIHFIYPFIFETATTEFIYKISLRNICAILVIISPFIIWQKDKFLKPGWLYSSIVAGLAILIYPTDIIGYSWSSLATIRFFFQHNLLFTIAFCLIRLNHEKISVRDIWTTHIVWSLMIIVIITNSVLMQDIGIISHMRRSNEAFQWQPSFLYSWFGWAVPELFQYVPFGGETGARRFWPFLYQQPFFIVGFPFISVVITLAFKISFKKSTH